MEAAELSLGLCNGRSRLAKATAKKRPLDAARFHSNAPKNGQYWGERRGLDVRGEKGFILKDGVNGLQ